MSEMLKQDSHKQEALKVPGGTEVWALQSLVWGAASLMMLQAGYNQHSFWFWKAAASSFLYLLIFGWLLSLQNRQMPTPTFWGTFPSLVFLGLCLQPPLNEPKICWETCKGCLWGALMFVLYQSNSTQITASHEGVRDDATNASNSNCCQSRTISEYLTGISESTQNASSWSACNEETKNDQSEPQDCSRSQSTLASDAHHQDEERRLRQRRSKPLNEEIFHEGDNFNVQRQPSCQANHLIVGKHSLDKDEPRGNFNGAQDKDERNDKETRSVSKSVRFADEDGKDIEIIHGEDMPSTTRLLVLLMIPKRQVYEFVGVEYHTEVPAMDDKEHDEANIRVSVSEILRELPSLASDPVVAKQRFDKLMHWNSEGEKNRELINALPIQSYDFSDGNTLVAVPKGYLPRKMLESSKVVLENDTIMRKMKVALRRRKNKFCTLFPRKI